MRIVIISGSPGTGKTTIAEILSKNSTYEKSVHIEVDCFWQFIRKGYILPWLSGCDVGNQNDVVINAVVASAKAYYKGGYDVFVAGTIGPWFIEPWLKIVQKGVDVRYIILRPSEETTISRATKRAQRDFFPLNTEAVKNIWHSFTNLGVYEANAVDTTGQTVEESVALIGNMINENGFRIV